MALTRLLFAFLLPGVLAQNATTTAAPGGNTTAATTVAADPHTCQSMAPTTTAAAAAGGLVTYQQCLKDRCEDADAANTLLGYDVCGLTACSSSVESDCTMCRIAGSLGVPGWIDDTDAWCMNKCGCE